MAKVEKIKDINDWMSLCLKHNVKCYVVRVPFVGKFQIESNFNGKITRFNKLLDTNKEANEALEKTYKFYHDMIEEGIAKV